MGFYEDDEPVERVVDAFRRGAAGRTGRPPVPDPEHLLPLADRPRFARKLLAVWRLQHLAAGDDIGITIWPGEWPADVPREVKGVPVVESGKLGGAGSVMVMGRARGAWKCVYQLAHQLHRDWAAADLAIACAYFEVPEDSLAPIKVRLHPDPETGEVPMWKVARGR